MKERRILSGLLALLLCFNLLAPAAFAAEEAEIEAEPQVIEEVEAEPQAAEAVVAPFAGEAPKLTFGADGTAKLDKGAPGRVYLDNMGNYAIDSVTYSIHPEDAAKAEIDDLGNLKVKDGYTAVPADSVRVIATVEHYTAEDTVFVDSFEGDVKNFTDTAGADAAYTHSTVNSLFGRNAATTTKTNGYPKKNVVGTDVTVTAWYYDNNDSVAETGNSKANLKFGFGVSGNGNVMGIMYDNSIASLVNNLTKTTYATRVNGRKYDNYGWGCTDVPRSKGWHKFEWIIDSTNGMTAKIDGHVVSSNPQVGNGTAPNVATDHTLTKVENVANVKTLTDVTLQAQWNNTAENQAFTNNKHFIDGVSVVKTGATPETLTLNTTVQIVSPDAPSANAYRLALADGAGIKKGEPQRVYIEGPKNAIVKEFEYSLSGKSADKVTLDAASGLLTVKSDATPQDGDQITVNATVKYYPADKLLWAETMETPGSLIPASSPYSLSHSKTLSRTGLLAGTPATTVKDGTFSPAINSTGNLVYWYYDPATPEELSRDYDDQAKFGIMIDDYPTLFLGVGIPSSTGDTGPDGVKLTPEQRNLYRTTYSYRAGGRWYRTNINRAPGWHKMEINVAADGTTLFIDSTPVCLNGETTPIKNTNVKSIQKVIFATNWGDKADMKPFVDDKHFIDDVYILKADANAETDVVTETLTITMPVLGKSAKAYTHSPQNPTVNGTYPKELTFVVKPELDDLTEVKVDGTVLAAADYKAYLDNGPSNAVSYPAELKGWKLTIAPEALKGLTKGGHSLTLTLAGAEYVIPFQSVVSDHAAKSYYLSNNTGEDTNTGDSAEQAWKSFAKLSTVTFGPGDTIYLDAESIWSGVQFRPNGSGGTGAPITLTKYNDGGDPSKRPILNGDGTVADKTAHSYLAFEPWRKFYPSGAIELFNVEHWEVKGIEITNYSSQVTQAAVGRNGIAVINDYLETQGYTNDDRNAGGSLDSNAKLENAFYRAGKLQHITIEDCYIHDVYGLHPSNGGSGAGGKMSGGINVYGPYDGLQIEKNIVMYCDVEGIRNDVLAWMGDTDTQFPHYMKDISISDNYIVGVPGDGVVISSAIKPRLANNYLSDAGYSYFAQVSSTVAGGVTNLKINPMGNRQNPITMGATNFAGLWFIGTLDAVAEYNESVNNVWVCQDGEAFDADMYCRGTVFQYNYTYRNNGGFCLFMTTMYNGTVVRYNVSVEDGEGLGSGAGKKATFYYNGAPDAIYNNLFVLGENVRSVLGGSSNTVQFYNNMVVAPKMNAGFHFNGNGGDDTTNPALSGNIKNNLFYPKAILDGVTGGVVKDQNITPASLAELPFYDFDAFMAAQPIHALKGRSALAGDAVLKLELGKGAGVAMTAAEGRNVKAPNGTGFDYTLFEGIKTVEGANTIGKGIAVDFPYKAKMDAVNPLTHDFFKNPLGGGPIDIGPYQHSGDPTPYFKLTLNGDGAAETLAPLVAKQGVTVNLPIPTKTGNAFAGWFTDSGFTGSPVSLSYTIPAGVKTLYAKWMANAADTFNVTFNAQGGSSVPPVTAQKGAAIAAPPAPTKANYVFGGWYTEAACENAWNFAVDTVTADTILYAKWDITKHTVTFNTQGGSEIAPANVEHGGKVTTPEVPTKAGHTFLGWYKEAEGTNPWNFDTTVTAPITLYASWKINQYTVTYNTQFDGITVSPVTVDYGTVLTSPTTEMKRNGYDFAGWYREATCENAWNFGTDKVVESITLFAKWTEKQGSLTVAFDSKGGSAVAPINNLNVNDTLIAPAAPTKAGHDFGGWYKEAACTNAWDFATDAVTASITLYAKWTIKQYTVTFNVQGGSAVGSVTANHGTLLTAPTPPTKPSFAFGGWYKDSACATPWLFAEDAVSGNVTLYAKWTPNAPGTFSVNFDSQGGSAVASVGNIVSGTTIPAPAAPTKEGYTFGGWYKDAACTQGWNFATDAVTANTTLYAKWNTPSSYWDGGESSTGGNTIPANGGGSTIRLPVRVDKDTGTVALAPTDQNLQTLIRDAQEKMGDVILDLSGIKNVSAASLPQEAADALAKAGLSVTVKLPNAAITLAPDALAGGSVTFSSTATPKEALTGLQAAMSGSYGPVVSVDTSASGGMSLALPYALKSGETAEGVRAWRLNADGSRTRMDGAYDGKSLRFDAEGNGLYVVGFDPVALWKNPYGDIAENAWYFDSVAYASHYGMFQGTGGGFDPNGTMTRAMFATVLFNLAGKPAANGGNPFGDVADATWYTSAVVWAYENGIVKGVAQDAFAPDRPITRQEMIVMLHSYCAYLSCPLPEFRAMGRFSDADDIAGWASEAMQALYQAGVLNGKGGETLAPADHATRAEAATLLSNFDWLLLREDTK